MSLFWLLLDGDTRPSNLPDSQDELTGLGTFGGVEKRIRYQKRRKIFPLLILCRTVQVSLSRNQVRCLMVVMVLMGSQIDFYQGTTKTKTG